MKNPILVGLVIFMLIALSACSTKDSQQSEPVELTVSAAASLNEALIEIKKSFENEKDGVKQS